MTRAPEGLKNEALRALLQAALSRPTSATRAELERELFRHCGLPGIRPNLRLAAAVGAELAQAEGPVSALIGPWAAEDAAPDDARVFLPIVAAHVLAQRIREGFDSGTSWPLLQQLAADERGHVRVGTLDALVQLAAREGFADELVAQASVWLEDRDRELCYGSVATAIEALGDQRVIAVLREPAPLFELLTGVIDHVADAPRAASRSDARRRVLRALGPTLARLVATLRGERAATDWFTAECERATHPEIRAALSDALQALPAVSNAPARAAIDELRAALEGSQKPVRDAARVRPGTGRGKRSRALR